jgi:hypothetical protein
MVRLSATARKVGIGTGTVERINRDVPLFGADSYRPRDKIFRRQLDRHPSLGHHLQEQDRGREVPWQGVAQCTAR